MDFQIRIAEAALTDFEEILAWSWENFPTRAELFGGAILSHIDVLRRFPYIGQKVSGRPVVRQIVHSPIVIYYRVNTSPDFVEVIRIRHASRRELSL